MNTTTTNQLSNADFLNTISIPVIAVFINLCNSTKNAYFWTPPNSASARRSLEKHKTLELSGDFWIQYRKNKVAKLQLELSHRIECSCKNVYRYVSIRINGITTTLTALKSILNSDKKQLSYSFINKFIR